MIGTHIGGRYEVLAILGEGGFGQVYRARDHELDRDVALKMVRSGSTELRDEAAILARFQHQGIVTVHDFGEHEGRFYLVMELVSGVPLARIAEDPVDPARAVLLASRVAEAMARAHEAGVAHRDLSLQNVMVVEGGDGSEIKVIDFGLGRVDQDENTEEDTRGTPRYMAPEQFRGSVADARTDIYGFGVCLYRLLSGRYPFEGEHMAALEYSVQHEDPPPLDPDLPADLRILVDRCMAKDPGKRPPGFQDIQEALGAVDVEEAGSIPELSLGRNPYLNRAMIKDPEDFFGRKREVRKIFSRLDAPKPQCISVVGDRRIGKSSLLNHVYNEAVRRKNMTQADKSVFVFLDFQSNHCKDAPGFIRLLISGLPAECRQARGDSDSPTFTDLEVAVSGLDAQGKRLLILMDEFERITNNEAFEQVFFSNLRSLANLYNVAYVTSSFAELQDLCHTREISDSPFFNIFSNLPLGPFCRETAVELISRPSEREGFPLERHADRLIDLAGLRPMNLQIGCSSLYEVVQSPSGGMIDWEEVEKNFNVDISPHYEFVWKRLSDQERDNLARIAAGKPVAKQNDHLNDEMRRRGLITVESGRAVIESRAFQGFIERQAPAPGGSWLNRLMGRGR